MRLPGKLSRKSKFCLRSCAQDASRASRTVCMSGRGKVFSYCLLDGQIVTLVKSARRGMLTSSSGGGREKK